MTVIVGPRSGYVSTARTLNARDIRLTYMVLLPDTTIRDVLCTAASLSLKPQTRVEVGAG